VVRASCAFLLICCTDRAAPRYSPSKEEQERLQDAVRTILPAGFRITRTAVVDSAPDWHSDEPKAGFLVEAGDRDKTVRICFLPRDWIGIRKQHNEAPRTCYWEGIRDGDRYKTITAGNDEFQRRVGDLPGQMAWRTPSLRNGGYGDAARMFHGRQDEVDRATQALVEKHCKTYEEFAEAAHSLIVLGVPAKAVFLRAAREVEGLDKDLFCGALGDLGGDDAIGVLCEIVADAKQEDMRRKYAAVALEDRFDKRIGPALHQAIKELDNGEAVGGVARVLMHQHYLVAAPDMLAAMKRIGSIDVAECLAGMRYTEAISEVRRLADDLRRKYGRDLENIQLVLERLTGDWGTPGETARVRISGPARVLAGEKVVLTLHVENIGPEKFEFDTVPTGLVINGRDPSEGRGFFGIFRIYTLRPGDLHTFYWDPTGELKGPGRYTITYGFGGARSNEITILAEARR
jgi:hypothetical protein